MVFLEAVQDGSYVLLLQELFFFDIDGIYQIALAVFLGDASFCDSDHGFLTVALEAEEKVLLECSVKDILSFLFLAIEVEEVVDIAVDHRGKDYLIVHGIVEGLEEANFWYLIAFLNGKTVVYKIHVELFLIADGL